MSLRVCQNTNGGFELCNREWDGIDKPQYDWVRNLTFEEAFALVAEGKAREVDNCVSKVLKNPLVEIARAAANL